MGKVRLYDLLTESINEELSISDEVISIANRIFHKIEKAPVSGRRLFNGCREGSIYFVEEIAGQDYDIHAIKRFFDTQDDVLKYSDIDECGLTDTTEKTIEIVVKYIGGVLNKKDAINTIQHEVEHAYQSSVGDSKVDNVGDLYKKALEFVSSKNELVSDMAYAIYLCNRSEGDAMLNGLYTYLAYNESYPDMALLVKSELYECLKYLTKCFNRLNKNKSAYNAYCKAYFDVNVNYIIRYISKAIKRINKKIGRVYVKGRKDWLKNHPNARVNLDLKENRRKLVKKI